MFQLKDFVSIASSMVNHLRGTTTKVTDVQPGSVARTLIEAPAVEIEELYLQMFTGLREAIPVSTFLSFGFGKLPAKYASGYVSILAATPLPQSITIPVGTQFTTSDSRKYLTTVEAVWAAGETSIRLQVTAEKPGTSYNAAEGIIDTSPLFGAGFTIGNSAINTGRDVETDTEREARFAEYVASLSRGTDVAIGKAAKDAMLRDQDGAIIEYVTRVGLLINPGYVRVYIYSSRGAPSAAILAAAQKIIDGYRDPDTGKIVEGYSAAGIRAEVLPITERAIDYSAQVSMLSGYQFTDEVRQSLKDTYATALAAIAPGGTLYAGDLETSLLGVAGVSKLVSNITSNITCNVFDALVPGTFVVMPL